MSEIKEIDRDKLADLLAKVQTATGASRALDGEIYAVLDIRADWAQGDPTPLVWREDGHVSLGRNGAGWRSDVVTASIDAALALVERMLPGWNWQLASYPWPVATMITPTESDKEWATAFDAKGATLPLAILAALLTALSQEPSP